MTTSESRLSAEQADSSSDQVERSESKLRDSIKKYGTNSYYYAHGQDRKAHPDAKVFTGPGIITGGEPERVDSRDATAQSLPRVKKTITAFTLFDSTNSVKIHLTNPDILSALESFGSDEEVRKRIVSKFEPSSFTVSFFLKDHTEWVFAIPHLEHDVNAEKCTVEFLRNKRVVISLAKKGNETFHDLKKKKD